MALLDPILVDTHTGWLAEGRTHYWVHLVAVNHAQYLAMVTGERHRVERATDSRHRWRVVPVEVPTHA